MERSYFVYILSSRLNSVLYTGVTNDIRKRIYEHKIGAVEGFTKKYHVKKLVYYEIFEDVSSAIEREKQIKSWKRRRKVILINSLNPNWIDLFDTL